MPMQTRTHTRAAPPAVTPRWLSKRNAAIYSGLTERTLQTYIAMKVIRSTNAVLPGKKQGRRLIDRESLDTFLEAGVDRPTSVIAMNLTGARHPGKNNPKSSIEDLLSSDEPSAVERGEG